MDIQDFGIIVTALVSFSTFIYVLIKDFLVQGNIKADFNSFLFLRVLSGNKVRVISSIIQRDFKSDYKSDDAKEILRINPYLKKDIEKNNFFRLEELIGKSWEANKSIYRIPEKYIIESIKFIDFGVNFSLPISIINEKKKSVFLAEIKANLKSEVANYIFDCSYILNEKALLDRNLFKTDLSRISGVFTGNWLKPKEMTTNFLVFILKLKEKDKVLTDKGLLPGVYDLFVTGIDQKGDTLFKIEKSNLNLDQNLFIGAFNGNDSSIKLDDNIK